MKTDPQNSDYEMEFGASRNFEPWREKEEVKEAAKKAREEEEKGDAMKALENRTLDSKTEMDILASLDEVKSLKLRQARLDPDDLLAALQRSAQAEQQSEQKTEQQLEAEDEELVKSIVFRNSQAFVRRIEDDDEEEEEEGEEGNEEEAGGRGGEGKGKDRGRAADGGAAGSGLEGGLVLGLGGTDKRQGSTAVAQDNLKKQKLGDGSSSRGISAAGSSKPAYGVSGKPSTNTAGVTAGGLLIEKVEEQPVFEVSATEGCLRREGKEETAFRKRPGLLGCTLQRPCSEWQQRVPLNPCPCPASAPATAPTAPVGLSLLSANYEDSERQRVTCHLLLVALPGGLRPDCPGRPQEGYRQD